MNHEETITLTRSELAALIEAAVLEALAEVLPAPRAPRSPDEVSAAQRRQRDYQNEWKRRKRAADPEAARAADRERYLRRRENPQYLARLKEYDAREREGKRAARNAYQRACRARKKAELEADALA